MEPQQNPNLEPVPAEQQPMPQPEQGARPAAAEKAPTGGSSSSAQPVQSAPLPPVEPANPGRSQSTQQIVPGTGANPAAAADADVIEKEWVDQAESVVKKTKEDPYKEEEAVESLQVDYLKKRYGHSVKKSQEE